MPNWTLPVALLLGVLVFVAHLSARAPAKGGAMHNLSATDTKPGENEVTWDAARLMTTETHRKRRGRQPREQSVDWTRLRRLSRH